MDLAGTWNTTGTPTLIKANVTETGAGSNAASLLMDLQVGGASRFSVNKSGVISLGLNIAAVISPNILQLGGSTVSTNRVGVNANGLIVGGAQTLSFSSGLYVTPDLHLTFRGAANLRFGMPDAAAPVAQTLSVQSVVAGTSNIAGANLTITGSQGTGTGAGGSIIFQVAPAGSSGTAQNALSTALTINADLTSTFGNTIVAVANKTNTTSAGSLAFGTSGASIGHTLGNGAIILATTGSLSAAVISNSLMVGASGGFQWANNNNAWAGSADLILARDASNTLAQRNANNGQIFRLYGRFTDITNDFERFFINAPTTSGDAVQLGTQKGATAGTARALELQTDGTTRLTIAATSGNITTTGSVTTEAPTGGTAAAWRLGTVASVSPTSQNRTIEVDIGGTIYYISAKTTND
jgi:hypothetical protein